MQAGSSKICCYGSVERSLKIDPRDKSLLQIPPDAGFASGLLWATTWRMKFCKALFARALPIVLLHRIFEILPHAGSVVWYVGSQCSDRKSESATLAGGLRCICYGLVLWNCVRLCHRLCVWSRTGQRVRLMNYRFPLTLSPAIGCECTTPWRQQIASCTYWARASGKNTCSWSMKELSQHCQKVCFTRHYRHTIIFGGNLPVMALKENKPFWRHTER